MRWWNEANCVGTDPEAFFGDKKTESEFLSRTAVRVCMNCTVREQCLNDALENDMEFGIWGGMRPEERRQYRSQWLRERSA